MNLGPDVDRALMIVFISAIIGAVATGAAVMWLVCWLITHVRFT